jgi:hypothetical protein
MAGVVPGEREHLERQIREGLSTVASLLADRLVVAGKGL